MTNYFSHDANARNDNKIIALRMRHDWSGYGIYFALLEIMFNEKEYKLKEQDFAVYAFSLNISIDLLKDIIKSCLELNLLQQEGNYYFSDSFLERMRIKDEKIAKAKKSASYSWKNRKEDYKNSESIAFGMVSLCERIAIKLNKIKLNKIKLNKTNTEKTKYREFVFLKNEEYQKLLEKFGQEKTEKWIDALDGHISSKGGKYKDHYKTILNWDRMRKEKMEYDLEKIKRLKEMQKETEIEKKEIDKDKILKEILAGNK